MQGGNTIKTTIIAFLTCLSGLFAAGSDSLPPVLTVLSPASSPHDNGNQTSISVSGTVTDESGIQSLAWQLNGGSPVPISLPGGPNWSFTVGGMVDGSNTLRILAVDASSNNFSSEVNIIVVIDLSAPTAVSNVILDSTSSSITFNFTGSSSGDADSVHVYYREGQTFSSPNEAIYVGSYENVLSNTQGMIANLLNSNQLYYVGFYVSDTNGNLSSGSYYSITTDLSTDTTPPGLVTNLTATRLPTGMQLSWTNPSDSDLRFIVIGFSSTGYTNTYEELQSNNVETLNLEGNSAVTVPTSVLIPNSRLIASTNYFFSVFSGDVSFNFSNSAQRNALTESFADITGFANNKSVYFVDENLVLVGTNLLGVDSILLDNGFGIHIGLGVTPTLATEVSAPVTIPPALIGAANVLGFSNPYAVRIVDVLSGAEDILSDSLVISPMVPVIDSLSPGTLSQKNPGLIKAVGSNFMGVDSVRFKKNGGYTYFSNTEFQVQNASQIVFLYVETKLVTLGDYFLELHNDGGWSSPVASSRNRLSVISGLNLAITSITNINTIYEDTIFNDNTSEVSLGLVDFNVLNIPVTIDTIYIFNSNINYIFDSVTYFPSRPRPTSVRVKVPPLPSGTDWRFRLVTVAHGAVVSANTLVIVDRTSKPQIQSLVSARSTSLVYAGQTETITLSGTFAIKHVGQNYLVDNVYINRVGGMESYTIPTSSSNVSATSLTFTLPPLGSIGNYACSVSVTTNNTVVGALNSFIFVANDRNIASGSYSENPTPVTIELGDGTILEIKEGLNLIDIIHFRKDTALQALEPFRENNRVPAAYSFTGDELRLVPNWQDDAFTIIFNNDDSGKFVYAYDSSSSEIVILRDANGNFISDSVVTGEYSKYYFLAPYSGDTTVNTPPQFITTPSKIAFQDSAYVSAAVATDQDSDAVSYSLLSTPSTMLINSTTGVITWTPRTKDIGQITISILASDGNGGLDTLIYVLTVNDVNDKPSPPVLIAPTIGANITGDNFMVWYASTDPDLNDTMHYVVEIGASSVFDSIYATANSPDTIIYPREFQNITKVPLNIPVYWRVKAVDKSGAESYSAARLMGLTAYGTIAGACDAPTGDTITITSSLTSQKGFDFSTGLTHDYSADLAKVKLIDFAVSFAGCILTMAENVIDTENRIIDKHPACFDSINLTENFQFENAACFNDVDLFGDITGHSMVVKTREGDLAKIYVLSADFNLANQSSALKFIYSPDADSGNSVKDPETLGFPCGGCGSGAIMAFIPVLFLKFFGKRHKKKSASTG